MFRPFAVLLATWFAVAPCLAQEAPTHDTIKLDEVFAQFDKATKDEEPGISLVQPRHVRFVAKLVEAPAKCNTQALQAILDAMGQPDFLQKAPVEHCIRLKSDGGRDLTAWVQDVLVADLNSDAKPGVAIEVYADFLAYGVGTDRARNMPLMLVSRFEPK
jgi:hypothetical protein